MAERFSRAPRVFVSPWLPPEPENSAPEFGPFTDTIDQWLQEDQSRPKKQRHTAKRIFERLREEEGFTGGYTTVKDYVRGHRQKAREMFIPLAHPPGHGQAGFGEAVVILGGMKQKIHFFAFDLPYRRGQHDGSPGPAAGHHLKKLKLPTVLRECEKQARQCAAEGKDHIQFLHRLIELELIDRERRMVERRSSRWSAGPFEGAERGKVPGAQKSGQFRFPGNSCP